MKWQLRKQISAREYEACGSGGGNFLDTDILFFFEGKPNALDVYCQLENALNGRFPEIRRKVAKTQISSFNRFLFAAASLPKRKKEDHLIVTFGLPCQRLSPRIFSSVKAAPNRWTHHVAVYSPDEVDTELLGWLAEAYEFSAVKQRSR